MSTAYCEGWGKVMFSVCSQGGGGVEGIPTPRYLPPWPRYLYPIQVRMGGGGTPRYLPPVPHPGQEWGRGYPLPWPRYLPPHPPTRIGQHMEYLIRCGQYASCVHAGVLSCVNHSDSVQLTVNAVCIMDFGYRFGGKPLPIHSQSAG